MRNLTSCNWIKNSSVIVILLCTLLCMERININVYGHGCLSTQFILFACIANWYFHTVWHLCKSVTAISFTVVKWIMPKSCFMILARTCYVSLCYLLRYSPQARETLAYWCLTCGQNNYQVNTTYEWVFSKKMFFIIQEIFAQGRYASFSQRHRMLRHNQVCAIRRFPLHSILGWLVFIMSIRISKLRNVSSQR